MRNSAAYYTKGLALSGTALSSCGQTWTPKSQWGSGSTRPPPHAGANQRPIGGRRTDGQRDRGQAVREDPESRGQSERTGERNISMPIGAYDFCPQPHKSVSVAFAFAQPIEQAMIFNAHLDAARYAVGCHCQRNRCLPIW